MYKYLSAARQYVGERNWEKGRRLIKSNQLVIKSQWVLLFLRNSISGTKSQEIIKKKQKTEYGSNNDFPNLTNDVWSIERIFGKKINFM